MGIEEDSCFGVFTLWQWVGTPSHRVYWIVQLRVKNRWGIITYGQNEP
jgi:hypothetical protein